MHDKLFVQFYLQNVTGEVRVNGIPVHSVPEELAATDQTIPVNGFIVAGMNAVDLVLDMEGSPSVCTRRREKKANKDAMAMIRVLRFPSDGGPVFAMPIPANIVAYREWLGEKDESEEAPRVVSLAFDVGAGFGGPWAWQSAPKLKLDTQTIEEARVICEHVRAAIVSGNTSELLRLAEIRFREVGEAFGATSDAEDIAQLERWIQQYEKEPDRVLPIDPLAFDFRLVADDRILQPLNKDWSHPVRMNQAVTDQDDNPMGEMELPYSLLLARVGGKLAIVR
ncbi:MAG: hypothetical protein JNL21_14065 [Myxococcales bacterium]|nr:hypothetical protein [Myxococcales bacterium]